ncbi:unnamed protein product, partial [Plutella xylostella]
SEGAPRLVDAAAQRVHAGLPVLVLQHHVLQRVQVARDGRRDARVQLLLQSFETFEKVRRLFGEDAGRVFGFLCGGKWGLLNYTCIGRKILG